MINVRRLAAVDLRFLGAKLIISEFTLGVVGPPAFGVFTLLKSHSIGMNLFGVYLISLGLNYVPLMLHAISIVRLGSAQAEVEQESISRAELFRKYRRQSMWLLVSMVVPIVALQQQRHCRRARASTGS